MLHYCGEKVLGQSPGLASKDLDIGRRIHDLIDNNNKNSRGAENKKRRALKLKNIYLNCSRRIYGASRTGRIETHHWPSVGDFENKQLCLCNVGI